MAGAISPSAATRSVVRVLVFMVFSSASKLVPLYLGIAGGVPTRNQVYPLRLLSPIACNTVVFPV